MGIVSDLVRWWNGLFGKQNLVEAFGVERIAVSDNMLEQQRLYRDIARGCASWNVPQGKKEKVPSLMLAGSISAEVAQNVVVGLESDIHGGEHETKGADGTHKEKLTNPRSEYLNEQYIKVKEKLRAAVIAACNGGEVVFKPYMAEFGTGIEVTVCETDCYWPIEYNSRNELTDVVFGAAIERGKDVYKLLERHIYREAEQSHEIIYKAFKSEKSTLSFTPESIGKEIPLTTVPEWAHLKDVVISGVESPLFVHFKIPNSDTIESPQRQGLPIWSKAIDMFRKADLHEARTDWEFESGELKVFAPADYFQFEETGEPILPEGKEKLFIVHDNPTQDAVPVPYNPEFRIDGLDKRMNQILRRIEFLCGLSYGILSDNNTQEKTAEEFKASKRRFFTTVSDIQEALGKAMTHLAASFSVLADLQGVPQGEYELTWIPSDAIMADREREFDERIRAQAAGWLSERENRAWWLGVDVDSEEARNLTERIEDEF